jgi:hypothetical protein
MNRNSSVAKQEVISLNKDGEKSTYDKRQAIYIALFIFLIALFSTAWITNPVYPIDDAYITLHNAKALLNGYDYNYDNISPLAGTTSLVHLLLVAMAMPLIGDWSSWFVAWFAITLFTVGTLRLAVSYKLTAPHSYLLLALALTSGLIWYQLLNGLETGLAMAFIVYLLAYASEETENSLKACGFLAGLSPFIRPELIALSGLIILWKIELLIRKEGGIKQITILFLYALLGFTPFAAFSIWQVGGVFPLTVDAKRAFFAEDSADFADKLKVVLNGIKLFFKQIGFLSLGLLVLPFTSLGRICIGFMAVFYVVYFLQLPGALHHYFFRYQYILLPFLLIGAVIAFSSEKKVIRILCSGLGLFALLFSIYSFKSNLLYYTDSNNFTKNELEPLAAWTNANIPANQTILIHDAGYMAHFTNFRLVDFVGLKTPSAIALHKQLTNPSRGQKRIDAIEIIAKQADAHYLIMRDGWEDSYGVAQGLKSRGWIVEMIRPGAYQTYRIEEPKPRISQ